jgi:ABC-type antimicrobial peptide transport system permease subunit
MSQVKNKQLKKSNETFENANGMYKYKYRNSLNPMESKIEDYIQLNLYSSKIVQTILNNKIIGQWLIENI